MDMQTAPGYIRENFEPQDRLAVVLIHKPTAHVEQRIGTAESFTSDRFQGWLRYMNRERNEVYISMNALRENATGRTKADVAQIRHVYLDFDHDGSIAVAQLMVRTDVPTPNYILETSPGKFQTIWRVSGFEKGQDEALMQEMVHELKADIAVHDSARVLRLPGFYNHKYEKPHFVRVESFSDRVHTPADFPKFEVPEQKQAARNSEDHAHTKRVSGHAGCLSQSERDWANVKRALAEGRDPEELIVELAHFRTDKPKPEYYARRTVERALASMEHDYTPGADSGNRAQPRAQSMGLNI